MISSSLAFVLLASSSNLAFSFVAPSKVALKKAPYLKSTTTRLYQTSSPPAPVEPAVMPLETKSPPMIIQGGMGVRISSWKLAREVSKKGGLGVISGTAMDVVFVRTLQDGKSCSSGSYHMHYCVLNTHSLLTLQLLSIALEYQEILVVTFVEHLQLSQIKQWPKVLLTNTTYPKANLPRNHIDHYHYGQ